MKFVLCLSLLAMGLFAAELPTAASGKAELATSKTKEVKEVKKKVADDKISEAKETKQKVKESTEKKAEPKTTSSKVVNINTASAQELESLNGVGPAKAQAIVAYRKQNGEFKTTEDLGKVPGIGDKTLENLKGTIKVR
jgi:competence protein ComEA